MLSCLVDRIKYPLGLKILFISRRSFPPGKERKDYTDLTDIISNRK